jgi:hypothetical protein
LKRIFKLILLKLQRRKGQTPKKMRQAEGGEGGEGGEERNTAEGTR